MRRAGHQNEETAAPDADSLFTSGEDAFEPPAFPPVAPRGSAVSTVVRQAGGPVKQRSPIELAPEEPGEDVRLADVLQALWRRKWVIVTIVAVCLSAAAVYNRVATPIYEARARLLLEPNAQEVVPFRSMEGDPSRLDYYVTQLEVLRSPALVRRALENAHLLTADPSQQSGQVSRTLASLTIAPVRSDMGESRIITVTYRSPVPDLAARVANGLAQTYVAQNLEARRQGSRDASDWLRQRLVELRQELSQSQGALQQYREHKDVVSLGDQASNIVVQKLAQLNATVTSARADRLEKEAVYQQFKTIQANQEPLDTFSPILSNTFIQGIKAEIAALEKERQQLSERLGELHPDMIRVNTSIENARRRLRDEMAKVVDGIQNDYHAAQAKEQALTASLEEQKRQVVALNEKAIGFGALQRDATSVQQMFDTVMQRAKEAELSAELQSNNAKILDTADVPRGPVSPRRQLNLLIALLGGGLLAVGLAIGLEYVNPRLIRPGDVADTLGLPLLGVTPKIRGENARRLLIEKLPPSFQEALRGVRTRVLLSPLEANRGIAVSSTSAGEGKTMVASNLAVSMAMAGRRVLLIDADLRRPKLHVVFDIPQSPGLSNVLAGEAKPSEVLFDHPIAGLFILTAGAGAESPADMLESERLARLIEGFSQVFDAIILDCPPVLAVADASIIANAAGSVVLVVSSGVTTRESALLAVERLSAVDAHMIGVVLNNVKVGRRSEYNYASYARQDLA
jgi:capsular exopolysaccharide synthesis family protein